MDTQVTGSVIKRKASVARSEFDARVMSAAKSLRLALAKVADRMLELAVTVATVEQLRISHEEISGQIDDEGILLLLDGANGVRGAAWLDPQFLTALIEIQTTGMVRNTPATARRVTRTDAAIVAPILDAVLDLFDSQLADALGDYVPLGCRFGDMLEDKRALVLALDAPDFDLYRLTLDIAEGAKTGQLVLMLPHIKRAERAESAEQAEGGGEAGLEANALEAQVVLTTVLARINMPLNEICNLSPGMRLPLDASCLKKAQLLSCGGHVAAQVSVGQLGGMRAIRLLDSLMAGPARDPAEAEPVLSEKSHQAHQAGETDIVRPGASGKDVVSTAVSVPARPAKEPAQETGMGIAPA